MRGGERCLEAFGELFPEASIYTLIYTKGSASSAIEKHQIFPSFLNSFPFASTHYRYLLPIFPAAIRSFDIKDADLILSSSHCVAKGIRVPERCCHISYVHSPMRYIWDLYEDYFGDKSLLNIGKMGMQVFRKRLQDWDIGSNEDVHSFIANSHNVAERIRRLYGRNSSVIHPPVNWHDFRASSEHEGFYLMVTALAPYKNIGLAIQAANAMKFPLKIVGQGPEEKRLRRMAGDSVQFLGWLSDQEIRDLYGKCRAVLFPGEEDFGIVPLEAMASGKPVIAYGKGGVLESVVPLNPPSESPMSTVVSAREEARDNGIQRVPPEDLPTSLSNQAVSGVFFYEPTVESLIEAIRFFEQCTPSFHPQEIRASVKKFDRSEFQSKMKATIEKVYQDFQAGVSC